MGSNLDQLRSARPEPRWTACVDDLFPRGDLEAILQARDAVEAMVASEGWNVLTALLHAEVDGLDVKLDTDRPLESRADYAALHGRRGGLMAPERALQALISRAESRLEEQRAKHEGGAESSPDRSTAR